MPKWGMLAGRRVLLVLISFGIVVGVATPSLGATRDTSVTWASLGIVRPLLVQPSGWGSPIGAQPSSRTFAWCSMKGVEISSGKGRATLVSDSSVGQMLKSSHLGLLTSPNSSSVVVTCGDVALDPSHANTVYAGFEASQGGSIPPSYNVALVTTNLGRSWRFVPPPRGNTLTDFAGFVERSTGVDMLYSPNYFFPLQPEQSTVLAATTSSNGGASWVDVSLNCPNRSPCVIFGPQAPQGACGMSEWQQSVLVGTPGVGRAATRWRSAGSVPTVSQCGSQQLIATSSGNEFLIDRGSSSALRYTRDGVHWNSVTLPKIERASVGGRFASYGEIMTLAPSGALVAVAGSPLSTSEHLDILEPGSSTWCAATSVLPAATLHIPVSALQSSATRLVVAFSTPIATNDGHATMALSFPLSTLRCRS